MRSGCRTQSGMSTSMRKHKSIPHPPWCFLSLSSARSWQMMTPLSVTKFNSNTCTAIFWGYRNHSFNIVERTPQPDLTLEEDRLVVSVHCLKEHYRVTTCIKRIKQQI